MHRVVRFTWILCSVSALISVSSANANELLAAKASINVADLQRYVGVLADDTFEGREAGSRGGRAAARYLGEQFGRLGLQGAGRSGYYQPFGAGSRNILAKVEGSDPQLRRKVIMISAHYDHVGYGNRRNSYGPTGYIHNGADDNASGVAALLEVAEALTKLPLAPKRSVVFALWDGEEAGLLGSKYWLEHPTLPVADIECLINMDMVGRMRNNKLEVFGSRTAYDVRRLISEQNSEGLQIDFSWELKENSDHYPFFQRGIPSLMLHTGLHRDYHRPSDDVERLNVQGIRQVTQLLLGLSLEIANRDRSLQFRSASRTETPSRQKELESRLPPPAGRLGVRWDANSVGPGVTVSSVITGSAAAIAGFRTGDRITQLAGRQITDGASLRAAVLAAEKVTDAVVERRGAPDPLTLRIKLPGEPVRVGIHWRTSDAEPKSVIVTRVIPGSPADVAGLQAQDRINQVGGSELTSGQAFGPAISKATGTLDLRVERNGRLSNVTIQPL